MPKRSAPPRSKPRTAFGDDSVYLEKYLAKPRHIEVQVLGDTQGHAIHLGERDCSLQRRHQKVWEEGPSPALNPEQRESIGGIVAKAMAELGYVGAGTVEFLYEDGKFFFIEMNTRVQVEHPVTEMITGIDIINEQIKIAAGSPLSIAQDDVRFLGAAIECRINAEHPRTFTPSPGRITYFHPPGGLGIRVNSAAYQGYVIPPYYDSLVGKLIVHGRTRTEALMRLRRALDEFVVDGIETTLPLFRALVRNSDVQNGQYDIHWLEDFLRNEPERARVRKAVVQQRRDAQLEIVASRRLVAAIASRTLAIDAPRELYTARRVQFAAAISFDVSSIAARRRALRCCWD